MELRQTQHVGGRDGEARRGGHGRQRLVGHRGGDRLHRGGTRDTGGALLARLLERRHRLAEATAHRFGQGRDGPRGALPFRGEHQRLAAPRAQPEHLGQTRRGDSLPIALEQADTDLRGLRPGHLHQLPGGPGMQTVRVEQADAGGLSVLGLAGQPSQHLLGWQTREPLAVTPCEQLIEAHEQRAMRVPLGRQTEDARDRPRVVQEALLRGRQRQGRGQDAGGAVHEPESLAQRQRRLSGDRRDEARVHAAGMAQARRRGQGQLQTVAGRHAQAERSRVESRGHGHTRQRRDHLVGVRRAGQRLGHAVAIQHVRELTQDVEVFVGLRGDRHQQVHPGAVVPRDALRKLQHAHARGAHVAPALRRAMRNRDAVAQIGGGLCLAGKQALAVFGRHTAGFDQRGGGLVQRRAPVSGAATQPDIVPSQRQHPLRPPRPSTYR